MVRVPWEITGQYASPFPHIMILEVRYSSKSSLEPTGVDTLKYLDMLMAVGVLELAHIHCKSEDFPTQLLLRVVAGMFTKLKIKIPGGSSGISGNFLLL